jgi:hypothetical protein
MMISCRGYRTFSEKEFGKLASEKEHRLLDESKKCGKIYSIPSADRIKNYPFSKAEKIQLVSYKNHTEGQINYYIDSLPRMNDTVCYSKLFEIVTLRKAQVDSLTDVLYNYGHKSTYTAPNGVYFIGSDKSCYNPKNAILFLDQENNVFEFIEICFECDKWKTSSEKIKMGESCSDKMTLLKDFFAVSGIRYGTIKTDE